LKALRCCCRQAKAEYEGELKLRSLNNDHVGAKEWDWVWSMLQGKEGSITATANPDLLAKAQEQASNTYQARHILICPCNHECSQNLQSFWQSGALCSQSATRRLFPACNVCLNVPMAGWCNSWF